MLTEKEIDGLIADRARYRTVVRDLTNWAGFAPGANKDAALQSLLANALNAIASESKPIAASGA